MEFGIFSQMHCPPWDDEHSRYLRELEVSELCDAVGIDPSLLPNIIGSSAIAGRVSRSASAATRIPEGVPVVPGGGDVAALAAGCGVIAESVLGLTLGTAGHVVVSSARPCYARSSLPMCSAW